MSQTETNKMIRVLQGTRRKFTVRINRPDGAVIEMQTDFVPSIDWDSPSRRLFLVCKVCGDDYNAVPLCEWESGMVVGCEKNPE